MKTLRYLGKEILRYIGKDVIEIHRKILERNEGNMLFLTFLSFYVQATAQNDRDLISYLLPLPLCIRNALQQQGVWGIGKRMTRPR